MINREIFIKAMTAGGDCGEKHAEKVFVSTKDSIHDFTTNLDLMLGKAMLEDESPVTNLEYALHQIQAAIKVLKQEKIEE